jgi:hypothetical protein
MPSKVFGAAGVVAVYAKITGRFANAAFVAMAPAVLSLRFIWRNLRRLKIGKPDPLGDASLFFAILANFALIV